MKLQHPGSWDALFLFLADPGARSLDGDVKGTELCGSFGGGCSGSYSAPVAGLYYLRIAVQAGSSVNYTLRVTVN